MDIDTHEDTAVNCRDKHHLNLDLTGWQCIFEEKKKGTAFKLTRVDHTFEFE
jgi:hypothetical protein